MRFHPCDYETCVFDEVSCVGTSTKRHGVMLKGSGLHLVTFLLLLDGEMLRVLGLRRCNIVCDYPVLPSAVSTLEPLDGFVFNLM